MRLALYPLVQQFQYRNGTNLVAGRIYVYYRGRTRLATIYKDQNGTIAQNPLTCDADGRAPCFVDTNYQYTIVVCDARGKELFSQDLDADNAININDALSGDSKLYIINSDGTISVNATSGDTWIQYDLGTFNKPLGVIEPLYWHQDDEEASIIGLHTEGLVSGISADFTELSSKVDELSGDVSYLSGASDYLSSVVEQKMDKSMSSDFYPSNNPSGFIGDEGLSNYQPVSGMTAYQEKGNYYSASNPSGFITGVDLSDYAKTEDLTAYQTKGDYYSASNPSGFINSDAISSMATTGFVADVSADITAMIPTALTGDYLTKESADTLYQPIGDYATTADITGKQDTLTFGYTDDKISEINGSALYGQGGGDPSDYELSAGEGISIVNDPINSATIISVSGDYVDETELSTVSADITAMIPTALTGDYLDKASADTLYYGINNPSGFITGVDLTPYQTKEDMTAYQPVGNYQTAGDYQPSGDYYSASNPSGFITNDAITGLQPSGDYVVHDELTSYATNTQLSEVSSTITGMIPTGEFELCAGSGIELVDDPNAKTTTISVTAQGGNPEVEAEVIAHSADWNTVGDKLDTTAFSDVSGDFLTAHQSLDGYLQNSDLEITDNKITGISGIPLSAGDELPSGTMNTSALEYNAVNEISGYNGSAIAQYGAEKQWLVHDDTIVHVANSAQYAFGCNISALQRLMGIDETVLYSGNAFRVSNGVSFNVTTGLSENVSSFNKIVFRMSNGGIDTSEIVCTPVLNGVTFNRIFSYGGQWIGISGAITGNGMSANIGGGNGNNAATCHTAGNWWDFVRVESIYGIGRKA